MHEWMTVPDHTLIIHHQWHSGLMLSQTQFTVGAHFTTDERKQLHRYRLKSPIPGPPIPLHHKEKAVLTHLEVHPTGLALSKVINNTAQAQIPGSLSRFLR